MIASTTIDIFHYYLPKEIICSIFAQYLCLEDVLLFDVAISNHAKRKLYIENYIGSNACIWQGDKEDEITVQKIIWLSKRNMKIRYLKCNNITYDIAIKIKDFGPYLYGLSIKNMILDNENDNNDNHINIESIEITEEENPIKIEKKKYFSVIDDTVMIGIIESLPNLLWLNIAGCSKISDCTLIRILESCPHIQKLGLSGCSLISDDGLLGLQKLVVRLKDWIYFDVFI